jgi:hypothetical protein
LKYVNGLLEKYGKDCDIGSEFLTHFDRKISHPPTDEKWLKVKNKNLS